MKKRLTRNFRNDMARRQMAKLRRLRSKIEIAGNMTGKIAKKFNWMSEPAILGYVLAGLALLVFFHNSGAGSQAVNVYENTINTKTAYADMPDNNLVDLAASKKAAREDYQLTLNKVHEYERALIGPAN